MHFKIKLPFFILLIIVAITPISASSQSKKPVVIGYVGGYRGLVHTDSIDAQKLTHINYAFVDMKDSLAWLHREETDTINFRNLNALKAKNPDLKILISIGGWTWSKTFSDAILTDTLRRDFAYSASQIVKAYDLDGVDIDWEYPGLRGDNNSFRPEDKQNYTLMFEAIRKSLDSVQAFTGKKYLVSTAVGGFSDFISHTEMDKVQKYLDFVNIMSYDFKTEADTLTGHHTNLYSATHKADEQSGDRSVREFMAAGVPASKIVLGIAFYGRGFKVETDENHGLYEKILVTQRGGGFTRLKDSVINLQGYKRHWDKKASAPYLFNKDSKVFITYDDEKSVKLKCKYVKKNKLAGVMFWEYFSDPKGYLLTTIADTF